MLVGLSAVRLYANQMTLSSKEEKEPRQSKFLLIGGIGENFKTLEIMFLHMKSLVLSIVRLWVKFQRKKMTASPCSGGSKLTFFICGPARTRAVKYVRY